MTDTAKVFFACTLGALVGSILALQFGPHFWFIGTILGGLAGYLAYDFKKIAAAVTMAYDEARGWRPNREYWRFATTIGGGAAGGLGTVASLIGFFLVVWPQAVDNHQSVLSVKYMTAYLLFVMMAHVAGFLYGLVTAPAEFHKPEGERLSMTFAKTNLFRIYYIVLRYIVMWCAKWCIKTVKAVFHGIVAIPGAFIDTVKFAKRFTVVLFREIHSDLRLLCGTDAAIGAAVGYFTGNALIGMLAGGLFGIMNFELISIRWLKVVPITRSIFR